MHDRTTMTRQQYMWTFLGIALVLAVFVLGCHNPTAPDQRQKDYQKEIVTPPPPPPPPPPVAKLDTGWKAGPPPECNSNGDCKDSDVITNFGEGCATETTAVLMFWDDGGKQVGPAYVEDAVGGGLASKIIRPGEDVLIQTRDYIDSRTWKDQHVTYTLPLTWKNVPCPEG